MIYIGVIAVADLAWESLHLPLYTLWHTGTAREKVFAVVHCTGGDILIASSSLILALLMAGDRNWPVDRYGRVALAAIGLGLVDTIFSEWLSVRVRGVWAYSEHMPVLPLFGFGLGLSPVLQWLIVPSLGFWAARSRDLAHRTVRWSSTMRTFIASLLIAFVVSVMSVSDAAAHAFLNQAVPAVGGVVATAPREIRLPFSENVEPAFSEIALATTDGQPIKTGPASIDPHDKKQLLFSVPPLSPGRYKVAWNVVSVDTHRIAGDYVFEIKP